MELDKMRYDAGTNSFVEVPAPVKPQRFETPATTITETPRVTKRERTAALEKAREQHRLGEIMKMAASGDVYTQGTELFARSDIEELATWGMRPATDDDTNFEVTMMPDIRGRLRELKICPAEPVVVKNASAEPLQIVLTAQDKPRGQAGNPAPSTNPPRQTVPVPMLARP